MSGNIYVICLQVLWLMGIYVKSQGFHLERQMLVAAQKDGGGITNEGAGIG